MKKVSASIMCADFMNLKNTIIALNEAQYDYLHFDVMDGSFYPDYLIGNKLKDDIRAISTMKCDYHLMVRNPNEYIDMLEVEPNDHICIHYELCKNIGITLDKIKSKGCKSGIAIDASTPISVLDSYYDKIDVVLIMMVNTGKAGNRFQDHCLEKIYKVKEKIKELNKDILIEVDGGVNDKTVPLLKANGADIFVGGSTGLFKKGIDISTCVNDFKRTVCL